MRAGALRQRIELQRNDPTVNMYNERIQKWSTINGGHCWAEVRQLNGRELERARQLSGNVSHQIRVRYNPDRSIDTKMRILYKGVQYDIESITDVDERGRELLLMCHGVAAGS